MKCKKELMGLAAILIVIFHFWMNLTSSSLETNLYRCTFIGVDLFFLVSGASLGNRKELSYQSFLLNRLQKVYLPFLLFAMACFFYKGWTWRRLLRVCFGIEFLQKGGGAFLWFLPGIMLLYLIAPVLLQWTKRYGTKAIILVCTTWLLIALVCALLLKVREPFILIQRFPIFMLGLFYPRIREYMTEKAQTMVCFLGLVFGAGLLYYFGGVIRLAKPLPDIYYLFAIPFVFALALGMDLLWEKWNLHGRALSFVGGLTLEIYGLQMIWGFDLETMLFRGLAERSWKLIWTKLASFSLTLLALVLGAFVLQMVSRYVTNRIHKWKEKK